MHGKRALVKCVHYGADEKKFYLRVEFEEEPKKLEGLEIQIHDGGVIRIEDGAAAVKKGKLKAAFRDILEIAIPLTKGKDQISLSFWQDGLPIIAIPAEGAFHAGELSSWNA